MGPSIRMSGSRGNTTDPSLNACIVMSLQFTCRSRSRSRPRSRSRCGTMGTAHGAVGHRQGHVAVTLWSRYLREPVPEGLLDVLHLTFQELNLVWLELVPAPAPIFQNPPP
eukprot:1342234-Rhodomonas_salina.1